LSSIPENGPNSVADQERNTPGSLSPRDAELIINTIEDTLYRVDTTGRLIYASPAAESLTGYSLKELMGTLVVDLYAHPDQRQDFLQKLKDSHGQLNNYEVELRHKQGHSVWVLIHVRHFYDESGAIAGIEGMIRNITERKRVEDALHKEREKALITLKSIGDGVITTDTRGRIEYMNPTAEQITQWKLKSARGKEIKEVFNPVTEGDADSSCHPVTKCIEKGETISVPFVRLLTTRDKREFAIQETASPLHDRNGNIIGAVLVFHDVTALWTMSKRLSYQATHDAHTGLINRREFEKRLENFLHQAKNGPFTHVLCYLDLDQFKIVNDTCGHMAGDELLKRLASTLHSILRSSDTIARLGGDEFGILIENCSVERGIEIAQHVRQTIKGFRFKWEEKLFDIGASIGLVTINAESGSVAEVLSKADAACFVAKDLGRNRIHVYTPDDKELSRQSMDMHWSHQIQHALNEDSFILYQQDLASLGKPGAGVHRYKEILLRLRREGEIVPPMAFLPAAERYNQIENIDRWVIRKAFSLIQQSSNTRGRPDIYAINLSGLSLANNNFMSFIVSEIDRSGVSPECICLEITETAAISNLNHAQRFMNILKGMGCRFALDDFGNGMASFNYLKQLPVDFLKIDGGIVRNMLQDPVSRAMVESINRIGHIMGLKTIAEYVENKELLQSVRELGIDYAQGYEIAMPGPWQQ